MRGEGATEAESAQGGSGERSEADGKREGAPGGKVSGDDSWRAPPVPIPNTEVKPPNADGTELGTAWESRKLPGSTRERGKRKFFPLPIIRENGEGRAGLKRGGSANALKDGEAIWRACAARERQAEEARRGFAGRMVRLRRPRGDAKGIDE